MPKIRNNPTPRLSNPQIEQLGKAADAARSNGQPTVDARIRNQFQPGTTVPQSNLTGTPLASPLTDIYAANAPSDMAALDPRFGFVPVRIPTKEEMAGASAVTFGQTGAPVAADIRAGGKMVVTYSPDRSPVQENLGSVPAWGVTAFIEFQPSGKRVEAPAVAFPSSAGRIGAQPATAPVLVDVPPGTTGVSMWFHQFKGADHPGEGWDSNYGRNYHFDVKN